MRGKPHKYRSKPCVIDGIRFASQKEGKHYRNLMLLKKAGEISNIELQPKFLLQEGFEKNGIKYRPIFYIADFHITYMDGKVEIIDCKGMKTEVYKLKKKLFEYKYPDKTITEF